MDALKRKMEIAAVAFFCTVTALIAACSCATTAAANLAQQTAAAPATEYVTLAYMEVQPEAEQEPELLYDVPMSDELQRYIREQAERQDVPFEIALAVIERESSYQPDAVSDTGDFGLMQMRPSRGPRKGSRGHSQRGAGADYGHHQQALRLRRTEMARNSVCKTAILFVFGGLVYFGLEVLFRGHSHWTMFVLGGFLFLILGELNEGLLEWDTPLIWQGVLGSAIVTGAELVTGMILNIWLGLGVWDYSGMPFNYKGQICLPFSILWIFVSIAAVVLDDWLRYWLFGEEHPHYTLFRRGESR